MNKIMQNQETKSAQEKLEKSIVDLESCLNSVAHLSRQKQKIGDFDKKNNEFSEILNEIEESIYFLYECSGIDPVERLGDDTYKRISHFITLLKADRGWIEFSMRNDKKRLSVEIETSYKHLGGFKEAIAQLLSLSLDRNPTP